MPGYVLSPDFIAFDNVNAADQLEDEFFDAFERLARRPQIGHFRSDLSDREVRFWPVGSYLIVYREWSGALEVIAVLHGARDMPEVIRKRQMPRPNVAPASPPR